MVSSLIGKTCPYCQFPLKADSEVVQCSSCKMPHHRNCWAENGTSPVGDLPTGARVGGASLFFMTNGLEKS